MPVRRLPDDIEERTARTRPRAWSKAGATSTAAPAWPPWPWVSQVAVARVSGARQHDAEDAAGGDQQDAEHGHGVEGVGAYTIQPMSPEKITTE